MTSAPLEIHVIADSSGETGARVARAARMQFPNQRFIIVRHARVRNADTLLEVFDDISDSADPTVGSRDGSSSTRSSTARCAAWSSAIATTSRSRVPT